ncbi:adenine phosphoribosyltransferase [Opitutaceae bacterium EW11]|nr:adenine phosphoribosyltransferase [Opitutaceae bacterium EW11]
MGGVFSRRRRTGPCPAEKQVGVGGRDPVCSALVSDLELIKASIRTVRDWPKVGVNFRDVTTLFHDPEAFRLVIDTFANDPAYPKIDIIAAVDARGFILGGALAYKLGKPFALVRKKGKLPFKTVSENYHLEYGTAAVEIHADACKPGDRILIVDDLIATGGTLLAATKLFRMLQGDVVGVAAIIDLPELGGSKRLREAGLRVHALCEFTEAE